MPVLAVLLAVVGVILIVSGIVYFAHGAAMDPRGDTEGERAKLRFAQVPYRDLLRLMPRCVKVLTDSTASHRDRVMAAGAFPVVVGIVLICLAVLVGIAALL
jgi:uncharacterized membrane protein YphA (DoxX/SURF4 family)